MKIKLQEYLNKLSDKLTYSLLVVIRWINVETGYTDGITTSDSLKITKEVSPNILGQKLRLNIISGITRYGLDESDCELILMRKEWLNIDEFKVNLNN